MSLLLLLSAAGPGSDHDVDFLDDSNNLCVGTGRHAESHRWTPVKCVRSESEPTGKQGGDTVLLTLNGLRVLSVDPRWLTTIVEGPRRITLEV